MWVGGCGCVGGWMSVCLHVCQNMGVGGNPPPHFYEYKKFEAGDKYCDITVNENAICLLLLLTTKNDQTILSIAPTLLKTTEVSDMYRCKLLYLPSIAETCQQIH